MAANNRMERGFLENIMHKFGFDSIWMAKIMMCVKYVSYVVMIIGSPTRTFIPTRINYV